LSTSNATFSADDAESGTADGRNSSKLLRYEFAKDEVYLGEVLDNKAHGHGVLHFRGCQYGGHWENGMERIGEIYGLINDHHTLSSDCFDVYPINYN
jgi:hypothetical protein